MTSHWMRGALAAVAIAAAGPAFAQDAKAPFEARYTELRNAMQARDEAAINAILTPDYVLSDVQGETRNRADVATMGGRMGGRGRGPRPDGARGDGGPPPAGPRPDGPPPGERPQRKIEQTVLSAAISGPVATVQQQLVMGGQREGDDGEMHTMQMTMKATDVWVKQGEVWMLKASNQTEMEMQRDGEVVFSQKK